MGEGGFYGPIYGSIGWLEGLYLRHPFFFLWCGHDRFLDWMAGGGWF